MFYPKQFDLLFCLLPMLSYAGTRCTFNVSKFKVHSLTTFEIIEENATFFKAGIVKIRYE